MLTQLDLVGLLLKSRPKNQRINEYEINITMGTVWIPRIGRSPKVVKVIKRAITNGDQGVKTWSRVIFRRLSSIIIKKRIISQAGSRT